jgi:hypothetical protein
VEVWTGGNDSGPLTWHTKVSARRVQKTAKLTLGDLRAAEGLLNDDVATCTHDVSLMNGAKRDNDAHPWAQG